MTMATTIITAPIRKSSTMKPDPFEDDSGPAGAFAGGAVAPTTPPAPGATVAPGIAPDPVAQAAGTGPGGGGCGQIFDGISASLSASQASENAVMVCPIAARNASSSVRPSLYDVMSATRASWPNVRTR
jgi:hypothetical protein